MKKIFLVSLFCFSVLWVTASYPYETKANRQAQIEQLDQDIQELEDMKRGYEAKALRHENQAEWLQFDDQAVLETRRHIQIAEENRQKAEVIQRKIDELKAKRKKLLESNGIHK